MRRGISDLSELLAEIQGALAASGAAEQLTGLSRVFYNVDPSPLIKLDPFGPAYREQVLAIYRAISRKERYDAMVMERTDATDVLDTARCPIPYRFADSRLVGEFLSCYGWILKILHVKAGADILEYGSGEGQLSIHLARMGCNVHAIDIERRFLDTIQRQCNALGISIVTQVGRFGDGIGDKRFDRVVFFEAFHHCLDHQDALTRIRDLLKPGGFICFSGEPIISAQSPDREILPYPWGLRLDGEAIRSIAEFGWMELGYSENYFIELLAQCGYSVESARCPGAWRGDAYIARPYGSRYPIERDTLISTHDGRSGWHSSEGTHRWTNGDAWFPLPDMQYQSATITIANLSDKVTHLSVSCSNRSLQANLLAGEEVRLTLELPSQGHCLRIQSDTFRPNANDPSSKDNRILGVAVKSIEFPPSR
jgi:SAM-dependent methyltransferase